MKKTVLIFICLSLTLANFLPFCAYASSGERYLAEAEEIIAYKMEQSGAKSYDEWAKNLASGSGNGSEWYVISLHQLGKNVNFSAYSQALADRLSAKNQKGTNAQRCALGFLAANCNSNYIEYAVNSTIGTQGIMSFIWGLHLLNNGAKSAEYSPEALAEKIASYQLSDGGFALSGTESNPDVTAMAISALAPYYGQNGTISNAVNTSLAFLSSAQTADGGFVSYGTENSESAAQVIIALCSLGIDPTQDERFIKNGKSAVDALRSYSVSGGGFAHTNGGAAHEISTQQALQAFTALYRLENGKTGVFLLDTQEDATPAGFRDVRFDGVSPTPSENSTDIKTIVCICVIAICAVCILIILYLPKKKIK